MEAQMQPCQLFEALKRDIKGQTVKGQIRWCCSRGTMDIRDFTISFLSQVSSPFSTISLLKCTSIYLVHISLAFIYRVPVDQQPVLFHWGRLQTLMAYARLTVINHILPVLLLVLELSKVWHSTLWSHQTAWCQCKWQSLMILLFWRNPLRVSGCLFM